jgi:uncharacterized membrane protein YeaQ/YmgE (transglycosylase-associated protein family)
VTYIIGFLIWIALGVVAGLLISRSYPAPGTVSTLAVIFGVLGGVIGGMIGVSPYIFHDPTPLRFGAILGGLTGALVFPFLYHFIARRAV